MPVGIGVFLVGGSKGRGQPPTFIKFPMGFNRVVKTNDWYYKPGDRTSWSKRSKPCAGGGQGRHALPAQKIGVNRFGGGNHP